MAKAVLTHKASTAYDDLPEERYHFPRTYLNQVEAAAGDFILYYEPRRVGENGQVGGKQAYFATARIKSIRADFNESNHFYADITDHLEFPRAVPFVEENHYYESALVKSDGSTNKGQFGRAVRIIPDREYELILAAGFATILGDDVDRLTSIDTAPSISGFSDSEQTYYDFDSAVTQRPIVEQLIARPFRERAFSTAVKKIYDNTCAVTGLRLINGGGRSEVQAAHIQPVASNGPDSPRNGIALSGTVHWMFDRGLLSLSDDLRLLLANEQVPKQIISLLPSDLKLRAPIFRELRPHPHFLKFHRENVFKG